MKAGDLSLAKRRQKDVLLPGVRVVPHCPMDSLRRDGYVD